MTESLIDAERFFQRLLKLKNHYLSNKSSLYGDADAICIPMGANENQDDINYSKSSAIHLYLLGYEFPDTLLVITIATVYFMATPKKCGLIEKILPNCPAGLNIKILHKSKDSSENSACFSNIVASIKTSGGTKLGTLLKGNLSGQFITAWTNFLEVSKIVRTDIAAVLGLFLSIKDETEIVSC